MGIGAPGMGEFPDEDAQDAGPLVPCPDCGRSFAENRLEKHMKICKKVFQQKRKKFDSAANRLGDMENGKQLVANAHKLEKEKERKADGGQDKEQEKLPAWKQKSLAFRQAVLAGKAAGGDAAAAKEAAKIQEELAAAGGADAGMTKCPHCGRTFNKEAGERHIPICAKTFGSKPGGGRLVRGGGGKASGPSPAAFQEVARPPPAEAGAAGRAPSAEQGGLGHPSRRLPPGSRSRSSGAPGGGIPAPEGFAGRRVPPGDLHRR